MRNGNLAICKSCKTIYLKKPGVVCAAFFANTANDFVFFAKNKIAQL